MRSLLAFCGMVILLAACESAPVTGRSQMLLVSESEERQMGLQAYREVLSKESLSEDARINALVEKVGRRIASAAERPPGELWRAPHFRWEFKTIDKNEPNAFCLPGGKVVVYTGILPIVRTETGLAVVIGHEVAHALARHGAERMSDQLVAQAGATAAAVALSATIGGRSRTYVPAMMAALGAGATVGYLLPMSRAQESEADRIGLILMALAESLYTPYWLVHALGLVLVAGRASHAAGMSQQVERFQFRVAGVGATFTVLIAAAILCVVGALRSGALF